MTKKQQILFIVFGPIAMVVGLIMISVSLAPTHNASQCHDHAILGVAQELATNNWDQQGFQDGHWLVNRSTHTTVFFDKINHHVDVIAPGVDLGGEPVSIDLDCQGVLDQAFAKRMHPQTFSSSLPESHMIFGNQL